MYHKVSSSEAAFGMFWMYSCSCMGENLATNGLHNKQGQVAAAAVTKACLYATTYGAKKMQRMVFIALVEFALLVVVWSVSWLWPLEILCA